MSRKDEILNWFTYHPPTKDQIPKFEKIRKEARRFAAILYRNTPQCADQTVALRKLREAVMVANAAIACYSDPII